MNTLFQGYELKKPVKAPAYSWQEFAIETIEYLDNPVKSQIFRWSKLKEEKLKACISYMKERGIHSMGYLITLMNLK